MTFDHRRFEIHTGAGFDSSRLQNQALSHPFTQQVDLIFPSNELFENALQDYLKTPQYAKGRISLSEIVADSASSVEKYAAQSGLSLLSAGSGSEFSTREEDVWCIDPRGVLTLSVCKNTYDGLGLVGKRVTFGKGKAKQGDGRHVISIPLYAKEAESPKIRAQREAALKRWEERRAREMGTSSWNVLTFSNLESNSSEDPTIEFPSLNKDLNVPVEIKPVRCQKNVLKEVYIPIVRLTTRPQRKTDEEGDWWETMEELFEWVGMTGLGATRLKANDRVDPFVAVYEPPASSQIGNVTHMQWTGFIRPTFVQSLINFVSHHLAQSPQENGPQFLSITSHACSWAPVSYIPHSAKHQVRTTDVKPPLRDPTAELDDSWSLIMTAAPHEQSKSHAGGEDRCTWVLVET
ncbi:ribonuclease P 40kDa subunit-domain-containing protein [Lentinula raphanica]|nr:ribonuclease P 40kDa subunit-domain-containing protein [Lentinula raphanica]KAJ3771616.1 ribonuclease P 40kDa subunit-domain-containing protein [Lentinula raphanica]